MSKRTNEVDIRYVPLPQTVNQAERVAKALDAFMTELKGKDYSPIEVEEIFDSMEMARILEERLPLPVIV